MIKSKFKNFIENEDIFGFEKKQDFNDDFNEKIEKPIKQFDVELMMELLLRKNIGAYEPFMPFLHEIRWGNQPGAIKLEIDTGYAFYIKQLGVDKVGNPRWVTKKLFQLNRQGVGGTEDQIAQEICTHLESCVKENIESTVEDYKDLESLTTHIYSKLKRVAKPIFIPEGIRKLNDNAYIIKFGVRGQGVEAANHMRVEQNQTLITYDHEAGSIRVINYNLESPVGKGHEWNIGVNNLDLYFFPTQDRDEISETIAVYMKYY